MLLYAAGGKFERHQDSEKQDGMFGTLVVVLPGQFEGGDLLVHDPLAAQRLSPQRLSTLKTHMWNPGAMDAFTVKYAAFYGDCPHQVKPVTGGFRLCLTYNLVNVETTASEPRFGSNHPLYATLKDTLCTFFCKEQANEQKRQRVNKAGAKQSTGFDITNPETHRAIQLVYVLSHKYTKAGLSFQYLKNKDVLVAASLHRFCEESKGAFEVFLGKCRFICSDLYDEDKPKDPPQELSSDAELYLYRPWVDASGAATVGDPQMNDVDNSPYDTTPWLADLLTEVAPAGLFDRKELAFDDKSELVATGNDGAMIEKWYSSAVLVLVPVQIRAARQFGDDPLTVLGSWPRLVESRPSHAKAVASGIALNAREWSITSPLAISVLDAVGKCGSLDVLYGVLASCLEIDFQPRLRQVVSAFDADGVATMLQSLDQTWQSREYQHAAGQGFCRVPLERNRVEVVASMLDGVHDAATIGTILDAIPVAPFVFETQTTTLETSSIETTPTEFARVIALVAIVSADRAKRLLETHSLRTLVLVVAPATLLFAESTPQANTHAVVSYVVDQLVSKIPTIRNLTYASTPWFRPYVDSPGCRVTHESFRRFLENTNQLCIVFDKVAFDTQLLPQIRGGYLMDKLSIEPDATDANAVVVTKTVRNELLCNAEDDLRALQKVLASSCE